MPTTDTDLQQLVINKLTEAQYNNAEIDDNELYFVTDGKISADDVDDTYSVNKFVTASDKTSWDAKSTVSGANDGTNWTSITINGTTKAIPSGGGGGSSDAYEATPTAVTSTYFTLSQTDIDYILTNKPKIVVLDVSGDKTVWLLNYADLTGATDLYYVTDDIAELAGRATFLIDFNTTSSTQIAFTRSSAQNMQTTTNLVTSISASSTDSQYPSAKCMFDLIGDIESLLQTV